MEPIVLAKDFSFVAAGGQAVLGDWIDLGALSEFQRGNIHVHCQTLWPIATFTRLDVTVRTSYDEVEHGSAAPVLSVNSTGSSDQAITADLADKVRLELFNSTPDLLMGIVSVWLQLKSD